MVGIKNCVWKIGGMRGKTEEEEENIIYIIFII